MEYRVSIRNIGVWAADQLSHPATLFQRKTWGVWSVYAHIRRSDRRPKKMSPDKDKALAVAKSMSERYGGSYSVYKCLFCDGWHVAKDPVPTVEHDTALQAEVKPLPPLPRDTNLDVKRILSLDIPDIAAVYGGVRGRTMSSVHQKFAWPVIRECGVRTIIDLREDGVYTRMQGLCDQYGMDYFYYPVDTKGTLIKDMVDLFPELCRRIDAGNFYIACAMGLHRTDIALCCYWTFYAADRGIEPPQIRGYHRSQGHNTDKIMRVLNAFYNYLCETDGKPPFPQETLNQRKKIIVELSKTPSPEIETQGAQD